MKCFNLNSKAVERLDALAVELGKTRGEVLSNSLSICCPDKSAVSVSVTPCEIGQTVGGEVKVELSAACLEKLLEWGRDNGSHGAAVLSDFVERGIVIRNF